MIRARSLRLDNGEAVVCSRDYDGTGSLWSSCDSGLLGASLVPPAFYCRTLLVLHFRLCQRLGRTVCCYDNNEHDDER